MRDLTQQILNKLISTSTGDINGKIIDLYDKMNNVYNDLASTSTSYTKGKIADLYTKFNNIYNELNSTSTSYMKGKINSIYSKIITDSSSDGEFDYGNKCNKLLHTFRETPIAYLLKDMEIGEADTYISSNENRVRYITFKTNKIIAYFTPPKSGYYSVTFEGIPESFLNISHGTSKAIMCDGVGMSYFYTQYSSRGYTPILNSRNVLFTPKINQISKPLYPNNTGLYIYDSNGNIINTSNDIRGEEFYFRNGILRNPKTLDLSNRGTGISNTATGSGSHTEDFISAISCAERSYTPPQLKRVIVPCLKNKTVIFFTELWYRTTMRKISDTKYQVSEYRLNENELYLDYTNPTNASIGDSFNNSAGFITGARKTFNITTKIYSS